MAQIYIFVVFNMYMSGFVACLSSRWFNDLLFTDIVALKAGVDLEIHFRVPIPKGVTGVLLQKFRCPPDLYHRAVILLL